MDGGEEIALGLVVTSGDGTKLLEPGEEILDQMARLEQVAIVVAGDLAIGLGRDDGDLAGRCEWFENAFLGVERLVADQRVGLHVGQQMVGAGQIMRFATGQMETNGVAQGIDQRMDFGAQSTARAADRLILAGFFCAPALC